MPIADCLSEGGHLAPNSPPPLAGDVDVVSCIPSKKEVRELHQHFCTLGFAEVFCGPHVIDVARKEIAVDQVLSRRPTVAFQEASV